MSGQVTSQPRMTGLKRAVLPDDLAGAVESIRDKMTLRQRHGRNPQVTCAFESDRWWDDAQAGIATGCQGGRHTLTPSISVTK
jgi:hypothetical protein